MAARDPLLRKKIAAAGGAARQGREDAQQRRADLAADRIESYVANALAEAPPLTEAQRDRLARLFREAPQTATAVAS